MEYEKDASEEEGNEFISTDFIPKIQTPRKNRRGWFEWKFTVGNLIEIVLIVISATIYITRLETRQAVIENILREHMLQNARDNERFVVKEVYMAREVYDKEFKAELTRRLDNIESAISHTPKRN